MYPTEKSKSILMKTGIVRHHTARGNLSHLALPSFKFSSGNTPQMHSPVVATLKRMIWKMNFQSYDHLK